MASFARFAALALTNLVESRPIPGWKAVERILERLRQLTSTLEEDWSRCPLAALVQDTDIAGKCASACLDAMTLTAWFADENSREIATATWSIFKTLLFTTLMICQSILSTIVFNPHPQLESASHASYSIALGVLHTLSHLAFVMPHFGGVASTSEGLPELKRAFYMALDVLSESEGESCRFVEEFCRHDGMVGGTRDGQ